MKKYSGTSYLDEGLSTEKINRALIEKVKSVHPELKDKKIGVDWSEVTMHKRYVDK